MTAALSARNSSSNRRYWPRMNGGIAVSYRIISAEGWVEAAKAWLSSVGPAPFNAGFLEPDPFMEFSVTGLRFDDVEGAKAGDTLIATLSIPPASTPFHITARVVRVAMIPEEEREPAGEGEPERTHRIAVEFIEIAPKASQALVDYTERMQDFEIATTADLITSDLGGFTF